MKDSGFLIFYFDGYIVKYLNKYFCYNLMLVLFLGKYMIYLIVCVFWKFILVWFLFFFF